MGRRGAKGAAGGRKLASERRIGRQWGYPHAQSEAGGGRRVRDPGALQEGQLKKLAWGAARKQENEATLSQDDSTDIEGEEASMQRGKTSRVSRKSNLNALTGNPSKLGKKQQLSVLLSLIHDIRPSDPQQARGGEIPVQGGP